MEQRPPRRGRDPDRGARRDPGRRYGPSSRDRETFPREPYPREPYPRESHASDRFPGGSYSGTDRATPPRSPNPRPWPSATDRAAWATRPGSAPPRSGGPVTPRPHRRGITTTLRRLAAVTRAVAVLASVVVFTITGVGWATLRGADDHLVTSDVIGSRPAPPDGATDILLVGVDSRTDAQGHPLPPAVLRELHASAEDGVLNTDTIILVRVPNDGSRAYAISIPRDSYVEIPDYRKDKINAAYPATKALTAQSLMRQGVTDPATVEAQSAAAGRRVLRETVEQLTGLTVDHYAEINLLGFYNLTNAIGGVDVCLRQPVNDQFSGSHFPAGVQIVSGASALAFVRQRHGLPGGDLDRIRRQQVFLAAVARKVLSAGTLANPSRLRALIDAVTQSVVLDSDWDILGFAEQLQGLAAGNIQFVTIPTDGLRTNDRGSVVVVDPEQVQRFLSDLIGAPPASTAPPSTPPPAETTVDVRNASGVTGLASRVADQLAIAGYLRGLTQNAPRSAASSVHYAVGEEAAARAVGDALGGVDTEPDVTVPPGTVRVYLGTDFAGAAEVAATTGGPSGLSGTSGPSSPAGPSASGGGPAGVTAPPITADGEPCVN